MSDKTMVQVLQEDNEAVKAYEHVNTHMKALHKYYSLCLIVDNMLAVVHSWLGKVRADLESKDQPTLFDDAPDQGKALKKLHSDLGHLINAVDLNRVAFSKIAKVLSGKGAV